MPDVSVAIVSMRNKQKIIFAVLAFLSFGKGSHHVLYFIKLSLQKNKVFPLKGSTAVVMW